MRYPLLILILISPTVWADAWVNFGGISKHIGADYKLREINPGMGVEWSISENTNLGLGFYRNSFDRESQYAGFNTSLVKHNSLKLGLSYGMVSGYGQNKIVYSFNQRYSRIDTTLEYEDEWRFFALPTLTYFTKNISITLGYVPKTSVTTINTFTLQLKFKIS